MIRWTPKRKAALVVAVRKGDMTIAEIGKSYGITVEEFDCWQRKLMQFGTSGLYSTKTQTYRERI